MLWKNSLQSIKYSNWKVNAVSLHSIKNNSATQANRLGIAEKWVHIVLYEWDFRREREIGVWVKKERIKYVYNSIWYANESPKIYFIYSDLHTRSHYMASISNGTLRTTNSDSLYFSFHLLDMYLKLKKNNFNPFFRIK